MSTNQEIKAGDHVMLKVGRNIVQAEVLRPMAGGNAYLVKSLTSCKEFIAPKSRIVAPMVSDRTEEEPPAPVAPAPVAPAPAAPAPAAAKKLTLMKAAVEVLKTTGRSLNTREIVKLAIEMGYWEPTSCKTPEQTLYGSIFREIKTKENPVIVKSEEKGKFRLP